MGIYFFNPRSQFSNLHLLSSQEFIPDQLKIYHTFLDFFFLNKKMYNIHQLYITWDTKFEKKSEWEGMMIQGCHTVIGMM